MDKIVFISFVLVSTARYLKIVEIRHKNKIQELF